MIVLKRTAKYQRARDKFVKNNLQRGEALIKALDIFTLSPAHPSLHLEKLGGTDIWTIRIDRGNRIFFMWADKKEAVFLLDVGPHDKYRAY